MDEYETFESFALRQIQLKRCDNEKDAEVVWRQELACSDRPKIQHRGQWLLGRFTGVRMAKETHEEFKASMKQSQIVETRGDIDEFAQLVDENFAKHRRCENKAYEVRPGHDQPQAVVGGCRMARSNLTLSTVLVVKGLNM